MALGTHELIDRSRTKGISNLTCQINRFKNLVLTSSISFGILKRFIRLAVSLFKSSQSNQMSFVPLVPRAQAQPAKRDENDMIKLRCRWRTRCIS